MRELLKGVVDIHVHGSPSITERVETQEFLEEMDTAGYRAVALKDHFTQTTSMAYILNRQKAASKTKVLGSLVLNNAVGGLNLYAVEAAFRMGARQIYFPTVSARNHCEFLKTVTKFGGGGLAIPENPIYLLDKDGSLKKEAVLILDYVKEHGKLMISTGHISPQEIEAVVDYAAAAGIKKLVVDHPYFIIGADIKQVERWAEKGAFINFTCSSLEGIGANGHTSHCLLEQTLERVSEEKLLISTDFGQPYNGSPVEGMYRMIELLITKFKVSEKKIRKMTGELPAWLVGAD